MEYLVWHNKPKAEVLTGPDMLRGPREEEQKKKKRKKKTYGYSYNLVIE
jgi:hypothetical protein